MIQKETKFQFTQVIKIMSNKEDIQKELQTLNEEYEKIRKKMLGLKSELAEMTLDGDYEFTGRDGEKVKLSEMFGDKKYLYTVHNMGKGCSYCTMWADGFNSNYTYIEKKGSFVLISPDAPDVMTEFTNSRDWKFKCYSSEGNTFTKDVGFYVENEEGKGHVYPGVSAFEKLDDGTIKRVALDYFGPTDFYCSVWHFYDLLPNEDVSVFS